MTVNPVAAKIEGVFLRPGVSLNGRLYTAEHIEDAVADMQARIAEGGSVPISMATSHLAANHDDVTAFHGRVTEAWIEGDAAKFRGEVANTSVGRDLAVQLAGGFAGGVSFRGNWVGEPHKIVHEAQTVTTADGIRVKGIDFTSRPGVGGVGVTDVQLTESAADPTLIFESVDDYSVEVLEGAELEKTITETGVSRAELEERIYGLAESFIEEAAGKPYGSVAYADPGYQSDGKSRYPIDTPKHIRAAWAYINQEDNAGAYSSKQLARIKSKIKGAAKKAGIDIQEEWDTLLSECAEILEGYATMTIDNGPATVTATGYTWGSAEGADASLRALSARMASAAILAMNVIDPDDDADIDVPAATPDEGSTSVLADDGQTPALTECVAEAPCGGEGCPKCGQNESTSVETDLTESTEAGMSEDANTKTEESTEAPAAPVLSDELKALIAGAVAEAVVAASTATKTEEAAPEAPAATETTEAAPTFTQADMDKAVAEAATAAARQTAEAVATQAVAEAREAATRKGEVHEATDTEDDILLSESSDEDVILESLAKQSKKDMERTSGAVWSAHPVLGAMFAKADRMAATA